jgi:hypothetical protein
VASDGSLVVRRLSFGSSLVTRHSSLVSTVRLQQFAEACYLCLKLTHAVFGSQCTVFGCACMVFGSQCTVFGSQCAVFGSQCAVFGLLPLCSLLGV